MLTRGLERRGVPGAKHSGGEGWTKGLKDSASREDGTGEGGGGEDGMSDREKFRAGRERQ